MKLEFYRQIFENKKVKFHENSSTGSRVFPRGWKDGQIRRIYESPFAVLRTCLITVNNSTPFVCFQCTPSMVVVLSPHRNNAQIQREQLKLIQDIITQFALKTGILKIVFADAATVYVSAPRLLIRALATATHDRTCT